MSGLLLDTHALLWWLRDDATLSKPARELIADPVNEVLVSAASVWEIAIKGALGKLTMRDDILNEVPAEGFGWLPILPPHAGAVRDLPWHHRDPFDRLLVAQALVERVPLISADERLDAYGIERRW